MQNRSNDKNDKKYKEALQLSEDAYNDAQIFDKSVLKELHNLDKLSLKDMEDLALDPDKINKLYPEPEPE